MKSKYLQKILIDSIILYVMNSKHRKHFDFTYKTQKYPLEDLLPVILFVLKTGISWRDCEQLKIAKKISYSTFWNTHNRLI